MTPSLLLAVAALCLGIVIGLTLRVGLAEVVTRRGRQRDSIVAGAAACLALGLVAASWWLVS